jgi:hypothetical protein
MIQTNDIFKGSIELEYIDAIKNNDDGYSVLSKPFEIMFYDLEFFYNLRDCIHKTFYKRDYHWAKSMQDKTLDVILRIQFHKSMLVYIEKKENGEYQYKDNDCKKRLIELTEEALRDRGCTLKGYCKGEDNLIEFNDKGMKMIARIVDWRKLL